MTTAAAPITMFLAPTAWGDVRIDVRAGDVVRIGSPADVVDPPGISAAGTSGTAASGAPDGPAAAVPQPIREAPREIRDLATRIAAALDGSPAPIATGEQVDRWLAAAGLQGARHRILTTLAHAVPWGVLITYGELAELAGFPRAARAAGTACATNPLGLVIPCHRVVPASGGIGGYGRAGADLKRRLLALEGVTVPSSTGR